MKTKPEERVEQLIEEHYQAGLDERVSQESLETWILRSIRASSGSRQQPSRGHRRLVFAVAGTLAVLAAIVFRIHKEPLSLRSLHGDANVLVNNRPCNLDRHSTDLRTGSLIDTKQSQVQIGVETKTTLLLDSGTQLRYLASGHLELLQGRLYYRHSPSLEASWRFKTPLGMVIPTGTSFDLEVSDEMTVNVFEGAVEVETAGTVHHIEPGETCSVDGSEKAIVAKSLRRDRRWWSDVVQVPWTEFVTRR